MQVVAALHRSAPTTLKIHTLHSLSDSFKIPSLLANPPGKKRAFINGISQQPETVLDARMGRQHGAAARNGRGPVSPQPKELERHDELAARAQQRQQRQQQRNDASWMLIHVAHL